MADINQYIAGGFNADEAEAEAPKGGGNVPDGEYYFIVSDEKVETSKDNEYVKNGQIRLCLTFEIKADTQNDTSYSGRKAFNDFWILHEDPKTLGRSKGYLGQLIIAIFGKGYLLQDSKDLLKKDPFIAQLKTKKGKNGKDYQNMVKVRSVADWQANPTPAAAAAPTQAAAAPAAPAKKANPWD